jgi:hypothetical protein
MRVCTHAVLGQELARVPVEGMSYLILPERLVTAGGDRGEVKYPQGYAEE